MILFYSVCRGEMRRTHGAGSNEQVESGLETRCTFHFLDSCTSERLMGFNLVTHWAGASSGAGGSGRPSGTLLDDIIMLLRALGAGAVRANTG